ncbi:unnamed protein product [Bursaphelenchus xylophilus]|uniref:(pine wood nematode) hypothetical protein n=1 Tax=Bursaphelenchus xylophilus TaxID=6326 RepID=A0A1I7RKX1_BURXY|nr:unnamed protein product [Bursaphelenchus xylophilus]CAG9083762.1 unnamed protein product [Bursaphelenchus xylophilus]
MLYKVIPKCSRFRHFCSESVKPIVLEGWVRKSHKIGKMTFLHVDDGRNGHTVQAVIPKSLGRNFNIGSAIRIKGSWIPSKGSMQSEEFLADQVQKMSEEQVKVVRTDPEELRSHPDIRVALPSFAAVVKLRSKLNSATHRFFEKNDFALVDTPMLTLNECEGAGEVFEVVTDQDKRFFEADKVFLPVSSQLHLEALICGVPNVYSLGTAFRAEKSLSSKHLSEFRMLEAECAFVDDLDQLCDIVEKYLRFVIKESMRWKDEHSGVKSTENDVLCEMDLKKEFPRISFTEAMDILQKKGITVSKRLSKQNELDLIKFMDGPVFIQRYPADQKPFYMRINEKKEAECFDLLAPVVGELAGGSIREYDKEALRNRCPKQDLEWYINLRSNGYPRSGGFGLGIERLMQSLFGIQNIKDTVAFPRWYKHCKC